MNVFRKGMNSFRNGMNMFRTGMKTFRIGTGIRGNQNYQKIRNFSGSKNLKEFFQNSKVLKSSHQTKPNPKSWNFETSWPYFRVMLSWGFPYVCLKKKEYKENKENLELHDSIFSDDLMTSISGSLTEIMNTILPI